MAYLVQKFGGTSVATLERIQKVARKVLAARQSGLDVVVVVSAMAKETDRLLQLAQSFSNSPNLKEVDVVAATGETVAAALTALAIQAEGGKACSLLGFQLPILTDSLASQARILEVKNARLLACFQQGEIPVVAGFQGITADGRVTTLGRGGSDTTAVAIAASLGARCEIYTDVDGVFSADPRICSDAVLLPQVSYRFMLEAAELGAKVMHNRSVEIGMRHEVPLYVRNSFSDADGTQISQRDTLVNCVALRAESDVAKVSLVGQVDPDPSRRIAGVLSLLSHRKIQCHGLSRGDLSLSFLVSQNRSLEAVHLLHSLCRPALEVH